MILSNIDFSAVKPWRGDDVMSKRYSKILNSAIRLATAPMSPRQQVKTRARLADILSGSGDLSVPTRYGNIFFFAGRGSSIASAAARFHEDEPETLLYIENVIKKGEVLWDVGANVGLYTLYAAKKGATVYAFEPSAFNFSVLVDHLRVNSLSNAVKPLCLALSDEDCIVNLNMAEVTAGHASNSLGTASNQFGGFDPAFKQAVVAMRADNFARQFASFPHHIKLDVDGLEPQIISGAKEVLSKVKSLLIEIEGENERNASLLKAITDAGLQEDGDFKALSRHGRNRLFIRR